MENNKNNLLDAAMEAIKKRHGYQSPENGNNYRRGRNEVNAKRKLLEKVYYMEARGKD